MPIPKNSHFPYLPLLILAACTTGPVQPRPVPARSGGPLYTDPRWIVDGAGQRVKLACVNWPSHLQPVVAEGLDKRPVDEIMKKVKSMGFNCARFTWPVELVTNDTVGSRAVAESFSDLGLTRALAGLREHNPWAADLTLIDAFKAMLARFQENDLMVVLDNHITVPGWCCGLDDGNGFFGDKFFNPDLWMDGLSKMAAIAAEFPIVVAMSLRNELRGPKSNVDDWYKYMQKGAETVHAANPDVLVVLSGLNYDKDLSFLRANPIAVSFARKLAFELHWYSFSHSGAWAGSNPNDACGHISGSIMAHAGFIADTDNGSYPLFVSEFGVDWRGGDVADDRFLNCFMAVAADQDWDFAVWALQGSYYLREGVVGMEEFYGLLDYNWTGVRNSTLLARLSSLQAPFRSGPQAAQPSGHKIIFHPLTGLCIVKGLKTEPLRLGPCTDAEPWIYTPQQTLQHGGMAGNFLQAVGAQRPIELDMGPGSRWNPTSNSKLHLSATARDGNVTVCLDVEDGGDLVITNSCKCLAGDKSCDPTSQWFKLVETDSRV